MARACLSLSLLFLVTNVAVLLISSEAKAEVTENKNEGVICEGRYVLCTSAPCVPDPRDPNTIAICLCEVNEGKSFGMKPCPERTPRSDETGVETLISTYSFAEAPTKPVMICPSGKPWTDCLDKPCTVDPLDPLKAICSCDIKRTSRFVTYGANCNGITCNTGFWSGATVEAFVSATEILGKAWAWKNLRQLFAPESNKAKS